MKSPLFGRLVVLGIALGSTLGFSACASSSPAVPNSEQRSFRRQSEVRADQAHLETCLAEAIASNTGEWDVDLDVAQSEVLEQEGARKTTKALSVDAEATQLAAPDPSIAVRHSEATFQRCLQQQLTGQRAPPVPGNI